MELNKRGLGFYSRVIHSQIDKRFNVYLKEMGLTKPQGEILRFICFAKVRHEKIKQKDIEETFHLSNPTVSGLLTRLEQKELITRSKAAEDKRIHFIEPTQKGLELQHGIKEEFKRMESEMLSGIDPELEAAGMEFLEKIFTNLLKLKKGD